MFLNFWFFAEKAVLPNLHSTCPQEFLVDKQSSSVDQFLKWFRDFE